MEYHKQLREQAAKEKAAAATKSIQWYITMLKYWYDFCYSSVLTVQFAEWTVENKMGLKTRVQQTHASVCPLWVEKSSNLFCNIVSYFSTDVEQ
jgi:hypothetical protein